MDDRADIYASQSIIQNGEEACVSDLADRQVLRPYLGGREAIFDPDCTSAKAAIASLEQRVDFAVAPRCSSIRGRRRDKRRDTELPVVVDTRSFRLEVFVVASIRCRLASTAPGVVTGASGVAL